MKQEDLEKLGMEIDRLFVSKGRAKPDAELKTVWALDLVGIDPRGIEYGFKYARTTPGLWPEVANVIEGARRWEKDPDVKEMLDCERYERHLLLSDPKYVTQEVVK